MNLISIQQEVEKIARKAGAFIKQESLDFSMEKLETKGHPSNLVSYVDRETEKILVEGLRELLPQASFITEEGTVEQSQSEYCWLIDPLDGTTNFMHGLPIYCTSIALAHHQTPILGVVYDMNREELFAASKGNGATLNGKTIRSRTVYKLEETLIATGFPYYTFEKYKEYMQILEDLIKNSHGLRRCGSAAIDMCWVASGRMDGYFEYNINSYDIAAGACILIESGGAISDFKNGNDWLFGKNIVAGAQGIHAEFQKLVEKNWF